MEEIEFSVTGDYIYRHIPQPELGLYTYKSEPIMDKETFIKAYKMWVEEQQGEQK